MPHPGPPGSPASSSELTRMTTVCSARAGHRSLFRNRHPDVSPGARAGTAARRSTSTRGPWVEGSPSSERWCQLKHTVASCTCPGKSVIRSCREPTRLRGSSRSRSILRGGTLRRRGRGRTGVQRARAAWPSANAVSVHVLGEGVRHAHRSIRDAVDRQRWTGSSNLRI